MNTGKHDLRRTAALIEDTWETCERTRKVIDDLNDVRREAMETVRFSMWWRFLDYDPNTIEFLRNLKAGDSGQ